MAKSAGDNGIKDQHAVGALQDATEDRSSCIAPLLMVDKGAERPRQNWDWRK
jgi:hypothetical protein